jgi:activator of 2-hydroxyglutaryl-CoA dehydratase
MSVTVRQGTPAPKKLAPLVETLLRAEMHIIAAMGIDDGSTNFRQVFSDMGIPANWILTPQNNPSEIRKAFAFASQSAVRASQAAGGAGFSQVAAGGFGAP